MDMDFYCHRPFSCIENLPMVKSILLNNERSNDIMIMSLEPLMHSVVLYNSTRVVIQDFFMITPKHPFIQWLLDDRNSKKDALGKKPFSYSLNKDIDRFKESNRRQLSKSSGLNIIELPSSVLHPLADNFNSEIFTRCKKIIDNQLIDTATYRLAKPYCDKYMQHDIFNPTTETVAVHMWSHVYFRWNLLRDPFEPTIRSMVEQRLPPRQDCPALLTGL
mmetsp:Transcript_34327/g.47189  ORF Transcript_34327/g.47189 Transcript_34327/m.47189 type:complete len:219 (-) Transcript_34327:137-793(-)